MRFTSKYSDGTPFIPHNIQIKYGNLAIAKKLAEYEDLEEQDLIIKMPCKVGTELYFIKGQKVCKDVTIKVIQNIKGYFGFAMKNYPEIYWYEIGTKVFLTEQEANDLLKYNIEKERSNNEI